MRIKPNTICYVKKPEWSSWFGHITRKTFHVVQVGDVEGQPLYRGPYGYQLVFGERPQSFYKGQPLCEIPTEDLERAIEECDKELDLPFIWEELGHRKWLANHPVVTDEDKAWAMCATLLNEPQLKIKIARHTDKDGTGEKQSNQR